MNQQAAKGNCSRWVGLFVDLHERLPGLSDLAAIAAADIRFVDPFNDLRGHRSVQALLRHTRESVQDLRFELLDEAWSGDVAFLYWRMTGRLQRFGDWTVTGTSRVEFDEDGKVLAHTDYWDAAGQFYEALPLLGKLLRWLRRRLAIDPPGSAVD